MRGGGGIRGTAAAVRLSEKEKGFKTAPPSSDACGKRRKLFGEMLPGREKGKKGCGCGGGGGGGNGDIGFFGSLGEAGEEGEKAIE